MYTTSEAYATYTGEAAPADYTRQELLATSLFKAVYPNFPSETIFATLETLEQDYITYAIFEQIREGVSYTGTSGDATSFSVGSFSIQNGDTSQSGRVAFMASAFLGLCGASSLGVG